MEFQITLIEANLKRDIAVVSEMDPFVTISNGKQKFSTTVHNGAGKKPKWNQTFTIFYHQQETLLKIFDKGMVNNTLICQGKLQMGSYKDEQNKPKEQVIDLFYNIQYAGKLKLKIVFFDKRITKPINSINHNMPYNPLETRNFFNQSALENMGPSQNMAPNTRSGINGPGINSMEMQLGNVLQSKLSTNMADELDKASSQFAVQQSRIIQTPNSQRKAENPLALIGKMILENDQRKNCNSSMQQNYSNGNIFAPNINYQNNYPLNMIMRNEQQTQYMPPPNQYPVNFNQGYPQNYQQNMYMMSPQQGYYPQNHNNFYQNKQQSKQGLSMKMKWNIKF